MSGKPLVGVLALQGSFQEHCVCLAKAGAEPVEVRGRPRAPRVPRTRVTTRAWRHHASQVRKPEQLDNLRGLIIPGGESTTMALVAERWGLVRAATTKRALAAPLWRCAVQALHTI